jgi:hypothetical protein
VSAPPATTRRTAVVRALVVLGCIAVLAVAFTVVFAASGALSWVAGVVAAAAVLATLVTAVRLFVTLSLLLHPPADPGRRGDGAGLA